MDGNDVAVRFIWETPWEGLPEAVQRQIKSCLVDIVAAMVDGFLTPVSDITAAYAAEA